MLGHCLSSLPLYVEGMDNKTFITLHTLSRRLGLPAAWIKAEAKAGRIPSLRAGRRLMFNPGAVESILIERAKAGEVVKYD
jgi:hypothetical protein